MHAMVLEEVGKPLVPAELPRPQPQPGQVLVKILACGVCRTDLHVVDGELPNPKLPLVPGHEVVGQIESVGSPDISLQNGQMVGIPWLAWTCGACEYCRAGRENLCDQARFHGYTVDGGYAEYMVADARYCFPLPETYANPEGAPLLCAGLIGFRALRFAEGRRRVGLYGFGAAAHLLIQVARYQGMEVYAFTRPGDREAQDLAIQLGAVWVGGSDILPPQPLDAAILFAPIGALIPMALQAVKKGGIVISAGIHMSDIPAFPYSLLWEERQVRSIANLTRKDAEDYFPLAGRIPVQSHITTYPLAMANVALADLRRGAVHGAAVLVMGIGQERET
ncbi:MAG: zinc-dependent alcohol dehydrogenase family protein [Gammaproteobacteria bacterium]|nr:zinc-dependent alcohol dehydrogenase family protein [Gammaproteobacteria bacterium]